MEALIIKNLKKTYEGNHEALKGIDLNVEEGDFVNEGMILVKIRPDNLISALDRAKANLNQQLANLASSKASKARSEAQLTQAELAFKRAES